MLLLRARFSVSLVGASDAVKDGFEGELASFTLDRASDEPLLDFIDRIDVEEDHIRTMLENMEKHYGTPEGVPESGGSSGSQKDKAAGED